MTNVQQLHIQIVAHVQTLKRELDRLAVRQSAIERCRRSVLAQKPTDTSDEDDESFDDITSHLDAIEYDLTTFKDQLRERMEHIEQGLRLVFIQGDEKNTAQLYHYILDGAKLCVRDASVAREGYDELIASINEITHQRDV